MLARTLSGISAILAAATILCFQLGGCDQIRRSEETAEIYAGIEREAVSLYIRLHPLRSSRLGFTEADSILFTFDPAGIATVSTDLERLLERVSAVKLGEDEEAYLDDLGMVIAWVRGELFAFRELRTWEHDPLLYAWMAEEALFGVPMRLEPTYEGERAAYQNRIDGLQGLFDNARRNLKMSAVPRIELARDRLRRVIERLDDLERAARERFASPVDFSGAASLLEDFIAYLGSALAVGPHTSFMLGTENLSRIYFYDEQLDLDPNKMTDEAEKQIRRLMSQRNSIRNKIDSQDYRQRATVNGTDKAADAIRADLKEIDRRLSYGDSSGASNLDIRFLEDLRYQAPIPKNPYLTVPAGLDTETLLIQTLSTNDCIPYLLVRTRRGNYDGRAISLAAVESSCLMRAGIEAPCKSGRSVRRILPSTLYRYSWSSLNETMLQHQRIAGNLIYNLILLDSKILGLARMIVVFRLHAGTYTTDTAAGYLRDMIGMSAGDAAAEVLIASVYPHIAYRGIADRLTADMIKKVSVARGISDPPRNLADRLRNGGGLPLTVIDGNIIID